MEKFQLPKDEITTSCRCWSFDQQPSLGVLLSIAEITLIHRFACWSKDQHGLILHLEIISSSAVVGLAVVGLIDQQPNLAVLLSIAEITLIQRFACWSKDQHGLRNLHHSPLPIHLCAVIGLAVVVLILHL